MSRLLINSVIFFLGVALAFGFVRYTHKLRSDRVPQIISLEKVQFPSTRKSVDTLSARPHGTSTIVSSELRIRILEQSLASDDLSELSLLSQDKLQRHPQYHSIILPRLKFTALEQLLNRFTESDWRTWPLGALDINREPTRARLYVNNLWKVNLEIARFAETSAYLLHGMFVSISNGKSYAIRQDLQYLVINAKEVLAARRNAASDAESVFDAGILQDPNIYLSFEKIRAELTKRFISEHPYQREAQLELLLALDPRAFDTDLRKFVRELLQSLALNASGEYRAEVLPTIVDSRLLSLLAAEDRLLARALAQLYLVGAVDAVEAGRLELAERLLLRSESTYGGLEAQKVLVDFIKQQELVSEANRGKPTPLESVAEKVAAVKSVNVGISWASIFIVVLLCAIGLYALRIFLERRSTEQIALGLREKDTNKTPALKNRISDPSQLDFSHDDLEEDIDFNLSEAVNR